MLSGFRRLAIVAFELQLVHRTLDAVNVIAHLPKILGLDELSVNSGMAVEIAHFDNLPLSRDTVAVGHSYRAHETLPGSVREIYRDGAMAVTRFFLGLRANDEGCGGDKLALVVLSRSPGRIGCVPVLANKAFGIRIVHRLHEIALGIGRHGCFTDAQRIVDTTK